MYKNFKAVCKLIIQCFSFLDIGTTQNKSVYFHSAIVYEFISSSFLCQQPQVVPL